MATEIISTKNHLALGRTLAVVDIAATLAGGGVLIALSPAVPVLIGFGAATVGAGLFRAKKVIKNWKDPSIYLVSKTETNSIKTENGKAQKKLTVMERKGAKFQVMGSLAKLGAGIGLATICVATGGLAAVGLAVPAAVLIAAGGAGVATAAVCFAPLVPMAAQGLWSAVKKIGRHGKKNESEADAVQKPKFTITFKRKPTLSGDDQVKEKFNAKARKFSCHLNLHASFHNTKECVYFVGRPQQL